MQAAEIRFVKGRLKFDGHKNSAPFPSAVVVFRMIGKKDKKSNDEYFYRTSTPQRRNLFSTYEKGS